METNTIIQIHEDEGIRTSLVVGVGPKFVAVIWADSSGIKIRKLPNDRTLKYKELDYPANRAKVMLRRMGKNFGITKSARRALRA